MNHSLSSHVPEWKLALYARGDLGWWDRLVAGRHISGCAECADLVAEFRDLGEQLSETPEVLPTGMSEGDWRVLSAEMTANIRLGMAAGECVVAKPVRILRPRLAGALAGVAMVLVLAATQRPHAGTVNLHHSARTEQPSTDAPELSPSRRLLSLPSVPGQEVLHTVNTRGNMRSRYVDDLGVTIVDVYVDAE